MFAFIREFFGKEKKDEDPLLFWAFLGPFFLLFTFAFLGVAYLDLWVMTFLGLLLCWKWKRRGCAIALFALVALAFYQHMKIDTHLWRFAIEISLALNLLITNFSLEHLFAQISSLGTHRANLLQNLSFMEEEMQRADSFHLQQQKGLQETIALLQKELCEKKEKISSFELLMRTLKRALIEEKREREGLLASTLEAERKACVLSYEVEELKSEEDLNQKGAVEGLIDDLNKLRQTQYQEELLNEKSGRRIEEKAGAVGEAQKMLEEKILELEKNLLEMSSRAELMQKDLQKNAASQPENQKAAETIRDLQCKIQELQKTGKTQNSLNEKEHKELKTLQSLYQQLRVQFKEKQRVLHQTRTDLFKATETLLAQEKESFMSQEETSSERALVRDFIQIDESLQRQEEERSLLEEIITSLSSQMAAASLPPKPKRGRKKKVKDENQELLFKNS